MLLSEMLSSGDIAALVYLWNPLTIVTCVGSSTSPIENLFVVLSLYGACRRKKLPNIALHMNICCFCSSLSFFLCLYLFYYLAGFYRVDACQLLPGYNHLFSKIILLFFNSSQETELLSCGNYFSYSSFLRIKFSVLILSSPYNYCSWWFSFYGFICILCNIMELVVV